MKYAYQVLSVFLCLFVLQAVNMSVYGDDSWVAKLGIASFTNRTVFSEVSNVALFAMLGLLLVFIDRPIIKRWKDWLALKVVNWLMMAATVVVFGYIFIQSDSKFSQLWVDGGLLGNRAGNEQMLDFVMGAIGIGLILDGTRRAIGWTLPILCALFAAYAMFGRNMPDAFFPHAGNSWEQLVQKTFLQNGVFGIALKVMFMYVFLFVIFGAILEQTGATGYVINFAKRLFGNSTGGPAKIAVISSGMMGSLSGSAVANTAATGTFTIPLMKASGFSSNTAGGVEAAASAGGALAPPVMGAGAYMMLEMLQPIQDDLKYFHIIKAALIPAILYYFALLMTVHFHAKRIQARAVSDKDKVDDAASQTETESSDVGEQTTGEPGDEASESAPVVNSPSFEKVSAYQGVLFFGAFVVLILALLQGLTAFRSVSISLVAVLLASFVHSSTRLDLKKLLAACTGSAKSGVALVVAAACVGIILGVISSTPLGSEMPVRMQSYAGESEILALLLLMVSTIILGMGLPSAVCYLLMANLIGGVLVLLDTPPLAAHLFIFYFGMMSMVTPPVALAAYAAAAISGGDVLKTSFQAFRFSLVGFALPFAFVFKPSLLMLTVDGGPASWLTVIITTSCMVVGTIAMAAGVGGFFGRQLTFWKRGLLVALGLVVFFAHNTGTQWWIQIGVVGLLLLWGIVEVLRTRGDVDSGQAEEAVA